MTAKYNDPSYIGTRYGWLTVIGFEKKIYNTRRQQWLWRVKCDCGNERVADPVKVICGKTKSCGCMKSARMKEYTQRYRTIHGGRHDRLYAIWRGMKERCYAPGCKDYKNYGQRGIQICNAWRNNYAAFRKWAVENGYSDNLTIERLDYDANYSPENCTWIPLREQAKNRRGNILVQYDGKTWVLSDLCKEKGLKYGTIHHRIRVLGWPVDRAIEEPIQKRPF